MGDSVTRWLSDSAEIDLENPLEDYSDSVAPLFLMESDHMPSENYHFTLQAGDFDVIVRREAISSIAKFSSGFDPLLSYLAVNYLDRFLSSHGMPLKLNKKWVIKLIAISCVSLAAKMMMNKTELYLPYFQSDSGIIFDTQTIGRMESLILGALKWRMRSVTPFSFIQFFISFIKFQDPALCKALKTRAIQIILKSQTDINFLEYKPSIISATALLSASHELFPLQYHSYRHSLTNCSSLDKEEMSQCYKAMQALVMEEYESSLLCDVVWSSATPVNVLDQMYSSSESSVVDNDSKRRKINGHHYS